MIKEFDRHIIIEGSRFQLWLSLHTKQVEAKNLQLLIWLTEEQWELNHHVKDYQSAGFTESQAFYQLVGGKYSQH